MSAVEALREGDLNRALGDLQNEVRASPDEPRHRIFLFQLLSVLGQWDRALTQLGVVRDLDAGAAPMARTYQEAIRCEALRRGVFSGERSPMILGEPEPWMAQMIEALRVSKQGDAARRNSSGIRRLKRPQLRPARWPWPATRNCRPSRVKHLLPGLRTPIRVWVQCWK